MCAYTRAFLVAQTLKNSLAMQETISITDFKISEQYNWKELKISFKLFLSLRFTPEGTQNQISFFKEITNSSWEPNPYQLNILLTSFCFNFLILFEYTEHKIYHLNHFLMYGSVEHYVLSHCCESNLQNSSCKTETLYPLSNIPHSFLPHPPDNHPFPFSLYELGY